jgi:hypothetical protein
MGLLNVHGQISATLPLATPYAATIAARASLRSWWRVQADKLELADASVTGLAQIAGTAGLSLTPPSVDQRPVLDADFFVGRYPAIVFDGATDCLTTSAFPYVKTDAFSWAAILDMASDGSDSHIAAIFATTGTSTTLRLNGTSSTAVFLHGNGARSIAAPVSGGHFGEKLLIVATSSTTEINLRVNDSVSGAGPTNNAQTAGNPFTIGAARETGFQAGPMRLAEFMVFQEDLSGDAEFNAVLNAYARRNYGVAVS